MTMGMTIIITGAMVAIACGFLGCFLILRRLAMVGDAISHAVLPGIVVAYLISGTKDSVWMLLGAAAFGLLCTFLIQILSQQGVQHDAAISVTFTFLFAVGVILVSLYTRQVHLDLDHVLYGEIAYVPFNTWTLFGWEAGPRAMWIVGAALFLSLVVVGLLYKEFKVVAFDPQMAAALGIPVLLIHYLLMGLVSVTTVASFESVGAILVVAMLIVPGATAYLLTDKLEWMLAISALVGILSSIFGYWISLWLDASIAGSMTVAAGLLFVCAFLFSPLHGVVTRWIVRRSMRLAAIKGGEG
ncbi:manganese/zinc/iron transport system permease protein [Desmospora profundinema]|uniref:Manganese/zinc/iron transport system permease protein n=2 Tax=Desmospora profundinema TaxID=1571184 RepID=A0ABU1IPC0_9BACL|nr:metal ABC transporter permease [Desmospora profundinema]MDR6226372.1 manganese/zinc/iron transport system permease protein [Desmospora profundinema]